MSPDIPRTRGFEDATTGSPKVHPILSAVQFAAQARDTGGATMDLHTGEVLPPHTAGYVVGGQPDKHGAQIPTVSEDRGSSLRLDSVLHHRARLAATVSPGDLHSRASLGYWHDTEAGPTAPTEVDASTVRADRNSAVTLGKQRNEKAIWDNHKTADIRLR